MATTKNEYDHLFVEAAHRVLLEVARYCMTIEKAL